MVAGMMMTICGCGSHPRFSRLAVALGLFAVVAVDASVVGSWSQSGCKWTIPCGRRRRTTVLRGRG